MERQKNSIDDLFREVLRDHEIEPSDRAKETFLKEVTERKDENWFHRGLFLYIALGILIIVGVITIYFITAKSSINEPAGTKTVSSILPSGYKTSVPNSIISSNTDINVNIVNPTPVKKDQPLITSFALQKTNDSPENNDTLNIIDIQSLSGEDSNVSKIIHKPGEINGKPDLVIPAQVTQSLSEFSAASSTSDTSKFADNNFYDTIVTQSPAVPQNNNKKQKSNPDLYFSLGIQYTPEWMFNTLEDVKYVNNFGAEGIFTFGKYSIRAGLGLSITKGTNELVVEYNDFLGSYNKLDSMSFSWDGSIHDYIPTYYMKSQDVWDSLMKYDYPKVVKRYTYLQIPVVFGYDFISSGRFSVGLRAGPILSILLKSKQLSEDYDPGNKKVISINNITPEQVNLNWQFMGGINASVRLSKNLNFEIEPMAKYYFNSVYEKSEITSKPWSIGLRCAVIIKL